MRLILCLLALGSLLLAACTPAAGPVDVKSFGLVAYQGEAVLGGREMTFERVFEHGKPVVLNFWAGRVPAVPHRDARVPARRR